MDFEEVSIFVMMVSLVIGACLTIFGMFIPSYDIFSMGIFLMVTGFVIWLILCAYE